MANKKKYLIPAVGGAVLAAAVACLLLLRPPTVDPAEPLTLLDSKGNVLITAQNEGQLAASEHWAYLDVVCEELQQIIARQEGCQEEEAKKLLFRNGYQVQTAFDSEAAEALKAISIGWGGTCPTGSAITDLQGNLLAVASTDPAGRQNNYAQERTAPCSAFKTLSVYTPAIEKGVVSWSTLYEDSPYKVLTEGGAARDWPANASGKYSMEQTPVCEALKKSLNTVAVKCLADVGVSESIAFLQDRFGIPLKEETYVVQTYGEEEVLGSLALGYPETGITPVEMAGYYQIFANGGIYTAPRTVKTVTSEDGTLLYQQEDASRQVIKPETADVMNKLLQGVVAKGGTGEAANCCDVQVAGKTGTGDDYADNWFVGVTPGYALAVWHGENDGNEAAEMFAAVIQKLYANQSTASRNFATHKNLYQLAYCERSGKGISPQCTSIQVGYYPSQDALSVCDICGKEERTK